MELVFGLRCTKCNELVGYFGRDGVVFDDNCVCEEEDQDETTV